jgi:hypothetical protein
MTPSIYIDDFFTNGLYYVSAFSLIYFSSPME